MKEGIKGRQQNLIAFAQVSVSKDSYSSFCFESEERDYFLE